MDKQILKLLKERYFLENETTWENDLALRVSHIYPPSYEYIRDKKFIPSSPTLMNANTKGLRKGTLSSCFTMGLEDSVDGIFDSLKEAALVTKASGGVGYVFSILRSSGENISTINRESSGPIPFMKIFNSMLDGVSQGGARKGAGMAQFDITHPDILSFIRIKNNKGELERMNLTVRIPDAFYEHLQKNPLAPHIVYDKNGISYPLTENGKVVTVGKLWDEIVEYAWLSAEPAIANVDIATRQCAVTNVNPFVLSNPCFHGETSVIISHDCGQSWTTDKIINILDKNVHVKDGNSDWVETTFKITNTNQPILKIYTNVGLIRVTPYHRMILQDDSSVDAKDIKVGDKLKHLYHDKGFVEKIEDGGIEDTVYCCTVPTTNSFMLTNGVIIGQCQEYWNIPYSSCNLGSINLTKLVINGKFDWVELYKTIRVATNFLNNVIDVNDFPIQKIHDVTHKVRPVGLGLMGYAHALYMMKIPFNSKEANDFSNRVSESITKISMLESIDIAKKTKAYEAFDYETYVTANERFFENDIFIDDIKTVDVLEDLKIYGSANSCNSSYAPTGTISYIANCSGGVEPVFALTYSRKIEKQNKEYEVVYISDPVFDSFLNDYCAGDERIKTRILKKVSDAKGSCQNVEEISEEWRKVFVVSSDLTPMEHLNSLAIFAKNVSTSVSKTINLPADATKEEISEVYLKAHDLGIIGVSVYRDGCRDGILVHNVDENKKEVIVKTNAPKRPKRLPCHVYRSKILNRVTNESENWIVFIGLLNDNPYEIIAGKITDIDFDPSITEGEMVKSKKDGKKVYQFVCNGEVIVDDVQSVYLNELREYSTRLMSLALRHGAGIEYLKEVLQKSGTIVDFNSSIVRGISKYVKETASKERCPKCNEELIYVESCIKCKNPECGYSKCS